MPAKKPRTEKQIAASRANGARSKGPKTPQGKVNSSKNAVRHALFTESLLFESENKEQFELILADLIAEHGPQSATEHILVENMAAARWQQIRHMAMQKAAMDHEIARLDTFPDDYGARAAAALRAPACSSELILRYAVAADRQFHRSLTRLVMLQDRRKEVRAVAKSDESPVRIPPEAQVPEEKKHVQRSPEPVENANPLPAKTCPNPAIPTPIRPVTNISSRPAALPSRPATVRATGKHPKPLKKAS